MEINIQTAKAFQQICRLHHRCVLQDLAVSALMLLQAQRSRSAAAKQLAQARYEAVHCIAGLGGIFSPYFSGTRISVLTLESR